jgi:hypothetical protein
MRHTDYSENTRKQAHHSLVVSMTTPWRCHRFESWLAYADPSLGLPAMLVEEIGLKIVVSRFFIQKIQESNGFSSKCYGSHGSKMDWKMS